MTSVKDLVKGLNSNDFTVRNWAADYLRQIIYNGKLMDAFNSNELDRSKFISTLINCSKNCDFGIDSVAKKALNVLKENGVNIRQYLEHSDVKLFHTPHRRYMISNKGRRKRTPGKIIKL